VIPIDVVERWLSEKHTVLWMDWDVTDPKERRAAAEWFRHEMDDLNHFWVDPLIEKAKIPMGLDGSHTACGPYGPALGRWINWCEIPPKEEDRYSLDFMCVDPRPFDDYDYDDYDFWCRECGE